MPKNKCRLCGWVCNETDPISLDIAKELHTYNYHQQHLNRDAWKIIEAVAKGADDIFTLIKKAREMIDNRSAITPAQIFVKGEDHGEQKGLFS